MEILDQRLNIKKFFQAVERAEQRILLLDYDGTLAPFKADRQDALPFEGVEDLLDKIMITTGCRVVFVSGRWTKDLVKLLRLKRRPEVWGSHGWERLMPDKTYHLEKLDNSSIKALTVVEDWLREEGLEGLCELKPACIAIHWRGLDKKEIEIIIQKVRQNWPLIHHNDELILNGFDGGLEIRVPGRNKGFVVEQILSEADSDSAVAYLGDDITDEDAFRSLGKRGLSVLVRKQKRATCADIWIKPPDELLAFLEDWLAACGAV